MLIKIEKISPLKDDERGPAYGFSTRESSYFIVLYRKQGTTSGDHYHKGTSKSKSPEIFYLVKGKAEVYIRDIKTGKEETHIIEEKTKLEVPANLYHSVKAITDIILLELDTEKENFDLDTVKFKK